MTGIEIIRRASPLDYRLGLAEQGRLRDAVRAGSSDGAVLLCEHPPVYTAGRRTQPADLPTDGSPVVDVDRGGRITWHGPGQLVAYPIVRLADPVDVTAWVRDLEQALIDTAAAFGVAASRIEGRSGAWVLDADGGPAKVGAIGLRVADGVSTHGISLNCDNALEPYSAIVPCGIADAGVTSLSAAAGRHVPTHEVADVLAARILAAVEGMRSGSRIAVEGGRAAA